MLNTALRREFIKHRQSFNDFNSVDIDIKNLNFQVPENMQQEILIILKYTRPVLKTCFTFIPFSI